MKLLLVAAAGLALVGCQTFEAAIRDNLPRACAEAGRYHARFVNVANTGEVPAALVKREKAAWDVASRICANPDAFVNTVSVINQVAAAQSVIRDALKAIQ